MAVLALLVTEKLVLPARSGSTVKIRNNDSTQRQLVMSLSSRSLHRRLLAVLFVAAVGVLGHAKSASKVAVRQLDLMCHTRVRLLGSFHACLLQDQEEVQIFTTYSEQPVVQGYFRRFNSSQKIVSIEFVPPLQILATYDDSAVGAVSLRDVVGVDFVNQLLLLYAMQDTECDRPARHFAAGPPLPRPSISTVSALGVSFALSCHENDLVCQFVDQDGAFAYNTLHPIARLPQPGLVVDVGAHVGLVSIFAAKLGHDVISVEAASISVQRLRDNIAMQQLQDKVTIIAAAAGQSYSCAKHSIGWLTQGDSQNYGGSSLFQWEEAKDNANVHAEFVPVVPLHDLLPADRVIDLMKMDIEGSECHALLGMHRVFAQRLVRQLVLEINAAALAAAGCSGRGLQYLLRQYCMTAEPEMLSAVNHDVHSVAVNGTCSVAALPDVERGLSGVLGQELQSI